MDAYELADWLENWENNQEHDDEIADLLRKQADEIKALQSVIKVLRHQIPSL